LRVHATVRIEHHIKTSLMIDLLPSYVLTLEVRVIVLSIIIYRHTNNNNNNNINNNVTKIVDLNKANNF